MGVIDGKLTVNNPFTVAIQLSESDSGFVPTSSLFTIHRTEKAEMSGSVRKIFWKAFHFTTDKFEAFVEYVSRKIFKKYALLLLRKRERIISADIEI